MNDQQKIVAIASVFVRFVALGGKMPFGVTPERIANEIFGLYFEPEDVVLARDPAGKLLVVVKVVDGLHCTEDPDPDYDLCHALGQTQPVSGLSPRNAGLVDGGAVRYEVTAEAPTELCQAVRFLIPVERNGWTSAETGEKL